MTVCSGSGQTGRLEFKDGWEEWWVICPTCGMRWLGGSAQIPRHYPPGSSKIDSGQNSLRRGPATVAGQESVSQQYALQGVAEHIAAMLNILGITNPDEMAISSNEAGYILFEREAVWKLYEVLTDLLPACWNAGTWYGYPRPEGCTMPDGLCERCKADGRRPPRRP